MRRSNPTSPGGRWLRCLFSVAALIALVLPASALRILVTNDDGFESQNLQTLFTALKAAGHDVILSAPYRDQSGVSAQPGVLSGFANTSTASPGGRIAAGAPGVGPTTFAPDQYYVDSTPVAAVIYGIEVLARAKWGAAPDLVIAGPNTGSNLGTVTPHSGTVGAVITAINRGIPAVAVSGMNGDPATAPLLAEITLRVIAATVSQGRVALPAGTGLNVNVPGLERTRTATSYRYVFTQVSTPGDQAGSNPFNEAVAFSDGTTVTVSPIQGTYQAPPDKAAQVLERMRGLFTAAIPIDNSKLINLSVRGCVGTGGEVQIVGFVVGGTTNKTILIRANGPALAAFGVPGSLEDPIIELYDRDNRLVASNDNWSDDETTASALSAAVTRLQSFAWPQGSKDAALLVTLSPGPFTAVVRGVGETSGVALIEAYDASIE